MSASVASATLTSSIVNTLEAFKAAAGINLNIYPGRPSTIHPPHAWIDRRRDEITSTGDSAFNAMNHLVTVEIVVVHGLFDSREAVDQRDAFVDAFNSWLRDNNRLVGLAGGNSTLERWSADDVPDFTPNWTRTEVAYYATQYRLEVSITD